MEIIHAPIKRDQDSKKKGKKSGKTDQDSNRYLKDRDRKKNENNLEWIQKNWPQERPGPQDPVHLVLLGGRDTTSFHLRQAQSPGRQDLTPSHWSHVVFFLENPKGKQITPLTKIYEVSLNPPKGFGFPPETNGVQIGTLGKYQNPKDFPNVAVLRVPVDRKAAIKAIEKFQGMRSTFNGGGLIAQWLNFVWGGKNAGNPLEQGCGIPSAVLIEYAVGAAGMDLTPGLASRSSCPEAIWQAAKWWYDFYAKLEKDTDTQETQLPGQPGKDTGKKESPPSRQPVISGTYTIDHKLV